MMRRSLFFSNQFSRSYSSVRSGNENKSQRKPTTILDLRDKFLKGDPITMVTSYDYTSAMFAGLLTIFIFLFLKLLLLSCFIILIFKQKRLELIQF